MGQLPNTKFGNALKQNSYSNNVVVALAVYYSVECASYSFSKLLRVWQICDFSKKHIT